LYILFHIISLIIALISFDYQLFKSLILTKSFGFLIIYVMGSISKKFGEGKNNFKRSTKRNFQFSKFEASIAGFFGLRIEILNFL